MVNVVAKIKVKAGEEGKVEKALRDAIPKVREEEGNLLYTLSRSQSDPTMLLMLEQYKDMDAFMVHSSTPYVAEMVVAIAPYLDGEMSVELFDEIA